MNSVSMLLVIFFLKILVNCEDLPFDDSIIVNSINKYRNEVVCLEAARNMKLISSSKELVQHANDIVASRVAWHINTTLLHITPDICAYQFNSYGSFEYNLLQFIQKCIRRSKLLGNAKVSWLWNPMYTEIGCAYSSSSSVNFFYCVLKNYATQLEFTRYREIDDSKFNTDLLKQNGALFTNLCPRLYRSKFISCYLLTSTRDYITNEVNYARKKLISKNNSNDLMEVKWDLALEMAAIDLSRFKPDSWSDDNCFTIASHPNGFVIHEFVANDIFLVEPNLSLDVIQFIVESDLSTRDLYAIGCTYFIEDNRAGLLCIWNNDQSVLASILRFVYDLKTNAIVNIYLVYASIFIIFLNIVILILFMKAIRKFKKQKSLRRRNVVESIYSKAQ